ncbi:hypothetical protein FRC17_005630 [Serendipita sp. 399]|nr:hypothetical protein FRC17_005630 [Serendipita sp. 399]
MANSSSLSNVVSSLVRAQMGASIPASTLDEELDRRVAELILKEARKKEATFNRTGSYSPQIPGNAAKTNKRFLSSIIKSTDEHNKAILKAQADAAYEVKQQREQEDRRERMKRAQEAVAARLGRSESPWSAREDEGRHRRRRSTSRERRDRNADSSRKDRKRSRGDHSEAIDDELQKTKKQRREYYSPGGQSPSSSSRRRREDRDYHRDTETHTSHRSRRRGVDQEEESHRRRRRRDRSRSRSPSPRRTNHRRSRSPKAIDDQGSDSKSSFKGKRHDDVQEPALEHQEPSVTTSKVKLKSQSKHVEDDHDEVVSDADSEIGPFPADHEKTLREYSSKMDKYFKSDYDPRLDVAPAASDGFIPPGAFDNWDWMLQVVRARREEKEERKRLEKLYKSDPLKKDSDKPASASRAADIEELMNMQYTKRGGTREWDEGKKEF